VRIELNRFEEAGLIKARKEGNKKMYQVNVNHPLFNDFHTIALKQLGIDRVIELVVTKLGNLDAVYLTGDLARGLDAPVVDLTIIGKRVDTVYLAKLTKKAEALIGKKIRTIVYKTADEAELIKPNLLIFGET